MLKTGVRRFLEGAVLVLLAALAVVVVVGVGFRKAGAALVWYDEVASILLAWLTYYGAALAALRRAHIGVPTLAQRLTGRARLAVVLVAEGAIIAFFAAVAWAGWQVVRVLEGTTLVSLPSVPAALAQSVIPIGAVLFILAQLLSLKDALSPGDALCPEDAPSPEEPRSDEAVSAGEGEP
ncbi:TRAP transporter small permease [Candidatus Palauibacter sp.]|uniref:TRAP transporter small permease n=1 Tax=Candidatus Palauibacter sp. TaxID=3101350 RepID=UPI003B011FF1